MGRAALQGLIVGLIAVLGACTESAAPRLVATVEAPAADPPVLVVGESLTLTAHVATDDGSTVPPYTATWRPSGDDVVTLAATHAAPGTEQVVVTPMAEGSFSVALLVSTERAAYESDAQDIVAWGGAATTVELAQAAMELVPGESRPATAIPLTAAGTVASERVAVTVEPASVASVNADGIVTANQLGTGTVTFTAAGGAGITMPLRVTAGTPAPPSTSTTRLTGSTVAPPSPRLPPPALDAAQAPDQRLVFDARGYPQGVVMLGGRTMFASWTGSGLGLEATGSFAVTAADARLALDPRGRVYVTTVATSPLGLVVDERRAPGRWQRRTVSRAGAITVPAMLPREGGGVWIAWHAEEPTAAACASVLRLAEVTDDAIIVEDVIVREHPRADTVPACVPEPARGARPLHLVAPRPGDAKPRLVTTFRTPVAPAAAWLEHDGTAWIARPAAAGHHDASAPQLPAPLHDVTVIPAAPGEEPTVIGRYFGPDPKNEKPVFIVPLDRPTTKVFGYVPFDPHQRDLFFALRGAGGRIYYGNTFLNQLYARSEYGGVSLEYPALPWTPGDGAGTALHVPVLGFATHDARVAYLADPGDGVGMALFVRDLPPAEPSPTAPDTVGTRLGSGRLTPIVEAPPLVASDGTRYVVGRARGVETFNDFEPSGLPAATSAALFRSDGIGAPWVALDRELDNVFVVGATLYASHNEGSFDSRTVIQRSTDRGETFAVAARSAEGAGRLGQFITAQGMVVLLDEWNPQGLLVDTAPDVGAQTVELRRLPAAPWSATYGRRGNQDSVNVLGTADGAWLIAALYETDGERKHLLLRQLARDGRILGERIVGPLAPSPAAELLPRTATLSRDGRALVILAVTYDGGGNRVHASRIDLATGAVTTVDAGRIYDRPSPVITLADGRFLRLGLAEVAYDRFELQTFTSTDGLRWSRGVPLRPGGAGQIASGLVQERDGGVLAVLGDTFGTVPLANTEVNPDPRLARFTYLAYRFAP